MTIKYITSDNIEVISLNEKILELNIFTQKVENSRNVWNCKIINMKKKSVNMESDRLKKLRIAKKM